MATENFFDESTSQSVVKATIVTKYFGAWSKIMVRQAAKMRQDKLGYIDLFAGTGYYEDGTESTPIKVLKLAIENPDLQQMLVSIFNDKDSQNIERLSENINNISGIERLKYQPSLRSVEIGEAIIDSLEKIKLIPSLIFIDPWGYKGLSLKLLSSFVKNWGCDCFFFFNFNRINAALNNSKVSSHMNALFGETRASQLREKLETLTSYEREITIIEEISEALNKEVGKYVLPFGFKKGDGSRTSHYLIFVSKHPVGYHLAKEIMAKSSSEYTQGVPSFEYCPASEQQPLLFEYSRPLDHLSEMLLNEFAGQKLTMKQVYEQHNVGRPFMKNNYKDALKDLEERGEIVANPSADKRRKIKGVITFSDTVIVFFPNK